MSNKKAFVIGVACVLSVLVGVGGTLVSGRFTMGAGAVDTYTQRVTLASDDPGIADLAALEALFGASGWTVATKAINAGVGTTELVAKAGEGKKIRVLGLFGVANVAGSVTLKSDSTAITGVVPVAAKSGWVLPPIPAQNIPLHGWCDTAANKDLDITTVTCEFDGTLIYATED